MSLEQLISTYGYPVIGVGTFLEGEAVLVLGGLAAHRGYLELPWVIFVGWLGSVFGDQLYFHIGRRRGRALIARHASWQSRADRVFALMERHQVALLLGFRFLYGMRTVTPLLLGASAVGARRFALYNVIGAALWALVVGGLGYVFGQALEVVLGDLRRYELLLFTGLVAVAAMIWFVRTWHARAG